MTAEQFTKSTRGKPNEQLYVTNIIAEPKYKYRQQEQVTVKEPQQKYRLGMVSIKKTGGGGGLKPVLRDALGFCHGSKHTVVWAV